MTFTLWRRNAASALKFEIMISMQNEVNLALASSYCHEPAPHAHLNTPQLILQTIDRNQGPRVLFVHVLASSSPYYVPALILACIAVRYWALYTHPKSRIEVFLERLVVPLSIAKTRP